MHFGQTMRGMILENIVAVGKVNGRRGRDRPREIVLNGVRQRCGEIPQVVLILNTRDEDL